MIKLDFSNVDPDARFKRGNVDHISPFSKSKPGQSVFLACRVSTEEQERHGDLDDQEKNLRQVAEEHELIVVGFLKRVWTGNDPIWLALVSQEARRLKADYILAESLCRFIRSPYFPDIRDSQARESDLYNLEWATDGFPLMTHLAPKASFKKISRYQSERGQRMKGRKGGRPRKKTPGYKRRETLDKTPEIIRLYQQKQPKLSQREIARRVGMNQPRVRRVILRWKKECKIIE